MADLAGKFKQFDEEDCFSSSKPLSENNVRTFINFRFAHK